MIVRGSEDDANDYNKSPRYCHNSRIEREMVLSILNRSCTTNHQSAGTSSWKAPGRKRTGIVSSPLYSKDSQRIKGIVWGWLCSLIVLLKTASPTVRWVRLAVLVLQHDFSIGRHESQKHIACAGKLHLICLQLVDMWTIHIVLRDSTRPAHPVDVTLVKPKLCL